MNFSKLSKEKRNNFILVVVITLAALGGLGFGLIKYQYANLERLAERKVNAERKFTQMEDAAKNATRIESDLADARQTLSQLESDVAPAGDMTMLPNFPYKQASMTVAGKAHYHDLGRFLADFENRFPHIRILNLGLDVDGNPQEVEMLAFRMDIVTLVKPN
jgi:Tfp pilus assembly protein PilO